MEKEKEIKVIPYTEVDGIATFRDSQIKDLYHQVWEEGLGEVVFSDGSVQNEDHWLDLMKYGPCKLHLCFYGEDVASVVWLNRIETTHCYVHFLFFKKFRGNPIIYEIGKKFFELVFSYGFEVVMGLLPSSNKVARRYARKLGFEELGEVPGILWDQREQTAVPGTFVHLTKERFNAL